MTGHGGREGFPTKANDMLRWKFTSHIIGKLANSTFYEMEQAILQQRTPSQE